MASFKEYFSILYSLLHLLFKFKSSAICCELRNFPYPHGPIPQIHPVLPVHQTLLGSLECSCSWCTTQLPPRLFCGLPLWGSFDNRKVGIWTRYIFSQVTKYSFCSPYRTGHRLHIGPDFRSDLIKRDRTFGVGMETLSFKASRKPMQHQIQATILLAKPYRGCRNSHRHCPGEGNCKVRSSLRGLKTSPSTQLG